MAARCTARLKPSESEGNWRLRLLRQGLHLVVEELSSRFFSAAGSPPAWRRMPRRLLVEEERVEQVLDRDELVPAPRRLALGEGEGNLDFRADAHGYSGSTVSRRGIPCSLA